jgi:hypothetical protein
VEFTQYNHPQEELWAEVCCENSVKKKMLEMKKSKRFKKELLFEFQK